MSNVWGIGLGGLVRRGSDEPATEHVVVQRPLQRVLAFRGRSIDDVVNCPIVKSEIYGYWKLMGHIKRRSEVLELERQWNSIG
jgi:hypothetical protein